MITVLIPLEQFLQKRSLTHQFHFLGIVTSYFYAVTFPTVHTAVWYPSPYRIYTGQNTGHPAHSDTLQQIQTCLICTWRFKDSETFILEVKYTRNLTLAVNQIMKASVLHKHTCGEAATYYFPLTASKGKERVRVGFGTRHFPPQENDGSQVQW